MKPGSCDVVVVGAGPAGSTAAASLVRRGRDVLLLDAASFPRDKPCGDGIPPGTIDVLNRLGFGDALRRAGFAPVNALRLVSGRGRDFRLEFTSKLKGSQFVVAPRVQFDDLLRRHAIDIGARFEQARVRAPIVEGGRVVGVIARTGDEDHEIRARVVIGADGATSVLARALSRGKPPATARGVAIRGYIDGIATLPSTVEFHFSRALAPGYGWIFPLGEHRANVGVIMRTDRYKRAGRSLQQLLDEFLATADVRTRIAAGAQVAGVASWQVPYATPESAPRSFNGAMLVGDAGGFVDSLTGEGIHNAVMTAAIAADVADEALARPERAADIVATFDRRCERTIGGLIARSYRFQKYLVAHPLALEALFVGARAVRGTVVDRLNRMSTDYIVR